MAVGGRFFAGFGAALFLVTSSALTIAVVLSLSSSSSSKPNTTLTANANNTACPSGYSVPVGSKLQGYTPQTKPLPHLEIGDLKAGTGASVSSGATVSACYIGALADSGVVFDTSNAHGGPQSFSLSSVIPGWQVGIPGMKVGGTRELLIPAAMAYGSQKTGSIPANSDLVFFVLVLSASK